MWTLMGDCTVQIVSLQQTHKWIKGNTIERAMINLKCQVEICKACGLAVHKQC